MLTRGQTTHLGGKLTIVQLILALLATLFNLDSDGCLKRACQFKSLPAMLLNNALVDRSEHCT